MTQRLGGMLIGLLLIGGAFLLLKDYNIQDDSGGTSTPTRDSRIPPKLEDMKCIVIDGSTATCGQQKDFNDFRSGHKIVVAAFRIDIYDHLESFLKKYDTPACHTTWDACYEMFNVELFTIDDKQIEELNVEWNTILSAGPLLGGEPSIEIQTARALFDPILNDIKRLTRTNHNLVNYKEYHKEVISILRGMQYKIKYALVDMFGREPGVLPRKLANSWDDGNQ